MAKKKKISRKELLKREDEFITFSSRLLSFAIERKVQLISTLCIVITLACIITGIRYFSDRAETTSFALLEQSITKYEESLNDKDADKAYEEVKPDFEKIITKYSGKKGGKLAQAVYANICYKGGDTDKAIDLYKKALKDFGDEPSLKTFVLSGLGYAYEAKKEYKTAINYFEMITSGNGTLLKDEAFYNLGRLYALTGEKDKSIESYKKIVSDYTDSMYVELAKEKTAG